MKQDHSVPYYEIVHDMRSDHYYLDKAGGLIRPFEQILGSGEDKAALLKLWPMAKDLTVSSN